MSKMITRTIKTWNANFFNTAGEQIDTKSFDKKPKLAKLASKRIEETGKMDFTIEIEELEEKRAISLKAFMEHSVVIEETEETEDATE